MTLQLLREEQVAETPTPLYELDEWKRLYGVTVGITTRGGEFDDYTLAGNSATADPIARWLSFREMVRGEYHHVCTGRQVHGTTIAQHHRSSLPNTWTVCDRVDGHVTGDAGVLLTLTVADCVPVYLRAGDTGELCLLHAGWRGIAGGVLEEGVRGMEDRGSQARNMTAHLGPSVCGDCYEVSPDVAKKLGVRTNRPLCVDLRAILAEKATTIGILNVSSSIWCTKHHSFFHSYRRDGAESGRMVAYLGRPIVGV